MSSSAKAVKHHVAHHFKTADQEFQSAKLGMWLFLTTEVLLFGGLFCAYVVFRAWHPEAFHAGSHALNWKLGALNTLVLITSSFTMAWGVRNAQTNQFKALTINLAITFICAGIFMVVKYFEYSHKIHVGTLWAGKFTAPGFEGDHLPVFFSLYFLMTGLHGFHVLIGMALISWLFFRSLKTHFYDEYFTPVEMVGLYWHLVDLIWIFLFPLLYLAGGVKL